MLKKIFFAFAILSVLSCSQNDNSIDSEDDNISTDDDTIIVVDDDPPVVSISGLNSEIEVETNLSFNIEDESTTTTRIFFNGEEIFSTTEVEFEFIINPFVYEVGNVTIKIVSTDSEGNSYERDFPIEIRHLLMEFNLGAQELNDVDDIWVFFNYLNGSLIEIFKPSIGQNQFYTEAIINTKDVYYTMTAFDTDGGNIIHNLVNETYLIPLGRIRKEAETTREFSPNSKVRLDIQTINQTDNFLNYNASGSKYSKNSIGLMDFTESIGLDFEHPEAIYVFRDELETGSKEEYRYTIVNPPQSSVESVLNLNEVDFLNMDDSFSYEVPVFDEGTFRISRFGYENETDLMENISHRIYGLGLSNAAQTQSGLIDLPILEDLEFYRNNISYNLNEKPVTIEQYGNSLDFEHPNWTLNSFGTMNDNYIIENEANEGVDYYLLNSSKSSGPINFTEVSKRVIWLYRTFENSTSGISTTPMLKLPSQITEELNDSFYTSNGLSLNFVVGVDFDNITNFREVAEYFALGSLILETQDRGFISVRFSENNSSSGKTEKTGSGKESLLEFNF